MNNYLTEPETYFTNEIVEHYPLLKTLAWASVLIFGIIFTLCAFSDSQGSSVAAVLFLIFFGTTLYLAITTLHQKVSYLENGFLITNRFVEDKSFQWSEVESVKLNKYLHTVSIYGSQKRKLYFSSTDGMKNLYLFLAVLSHKTSIAINEDVSNLITSISELEP